MKILLAHNRYQHRGGEDTVYEQERDLLAANGHQVIEYLKDNRALESMPRLKLAASTVWSRTAHQEVDALIRRERPDVVHVHNTLPQISPSIYYAARRQGVPVVQTLHNYRLLCANGLLMRDGVVCEECVGKAIGWPAVRHACYRQSRSATLAVVGSIVLHRAVGTYREQVARYIAMCEFSRNKLLAAGVPADRIVLKPNFAPDKHADADLQAPRSGALFVGRLSAEKGIAVLIQAWKALDVDLQLIGGGELSEPLRAALSPTVHVRGFVSDPELMQATRRAQFLVLPSLVYEGFPMVIAEAFAAGLPIIASRLGAMAELVRDGETGLHFNAGDAADLAAKVRWAVANPQAMSEMSMRARQTYLRLYTPQANYRRLMEIYDDARRTVRPAAESAALSSSDA
jgi:glycosyltransferase involved in cell wall biosynthesis